MNLAVVEATEAFNSGLGRFIVQVSEVSGDPDRELLDTVWDWAMGQPTGEAIFVLYTLMDTVIRHVAKDGEDGKTPDWWPKYGAWMRDFLGTTVGQRVLAAMETVSAPPTSVESLCESMSRTKPNMGQVIQALFMGLVALCVSPLPVAEA